MKRSHWLMMMALAGGGWLAFFGDTTSDSGVVNAVERAPSPRTARLPAPSINSVAAVKPIVSEPVLALQSRETLIGGAHDGAHDGSSAALFGTQTWAPPPPPPVIVKPPPPPPPTAPPLPFTYLGKQVKDGKWQVFLGRGDQTFIAVEQLVIDGTYRVDTIAPPQLNFVYLPLQKMQTLHIGGAN